MVETIPISSQKYQNSDNTTVPGPRNSTEVSCLLRVLQKNIVSVSICALTLITLLLTVAIILLLNRDQVPVTINITSGEKSVQKENQSIDISSVVSTSIPSIDSKKDLSRPGSLKLVTRLEWLAQPPVEPANPLPVPVPYVIIHHTATENCSSQAQCIFHVRFIQSFHIESRNWYDIGYNFLIGGDGGAYEGRGWKAVGAHTYGYNNNSLGIAFIGNFNILKPPQRQVEACKQLIAKGVELGYIKEDYKLLAVRQLQKTQSPGSALYEEMKTWDHWSLTL